MATGCNMDRSTKMPGMNGTRLSDAAIALYPSFPAPWHRVHMISKQWPQGTNLSQPSISRQIKALETSLHEQLLERTGRGMKLTAKGRLVMEYAAEIFSLGTEMVRSLRGKGSARNLRLNIGITDSLPKLVAWRLIRPAVKAFPNLQLS